MPKTPLENESPHRAPNSHRFQPLPRTRQVSVDRMQHQPRRQRRIPRGESCPRLRVIHGRRRENDHYRRRVSVYINLLCHRYSLHPVRAKYPWVGLLNDEEKDKMLTSGDTRPSAHATSLFLAADSSMITIGGGYVTFAAWWLDYDWVFVVFATFQG